MFSLKDLLPQLTSASVEIPESFSQNGFKESLYIKGTRPALSSAIGILNCSASLYPKSLPPKVGIESAPVATIKDLQSILKKFSTLLSLCPSTLNLS